MTKEVINVGLYGGKGVFGGRETPLEASVISCDKFEDCSYFRDGQCLAVRSFLSEGCKFGSVENIRGYTSRSKKYSRFKREWKEHEKYSKLSHPPKKLGLIDGLVVFPYPYVQIEKGEQGDLKIKDPSFGNKIAYIDYNDFSVDFIYRLCTYRPLAFLGGEITDYQKEIVPLFLTHLKEVLPDKYREFIGKYPRFSKNVSYVGRKALLKTIKPSYVHYKSKNYPELNEEWYWDGELLVYKNGYVSSFKITEDYDIEEIKLRPSDKSVVKISDNEQVTENTIFVD